jgi:multisubunit Na+/H+ antiporter MnhC subunit
MSQWAKIVISVLIIVGFFVLAGIKILPVEVTVSIISGGVGAVIMYWFKEKEIARLKEQILKEQIKKNDSK